MIPCIHYLWTTLPNISPQWQLLLLFFSSPTKEKGRRDDRGESGLSSSWLPIITVWVPFLTHSLTHIHTQRVRMLNQPPTCWQNTHIKTVKCTESPLTAHCWRLERWKRCSTSEAQTMNRRQRASALTFEMGMMTYILIWPDLFLIYFTGCEYVVQTDSLIFILGEREREMWCKSSVLQLKMRECFTISFCQLWSERKGEALCNKLFSLTASSVCAKIILKDKKKTATAVKRRNVTFTGLSSAFIFYNIMCIIFNNKPWVTDVHFSS